ncbi:MULTISPECIES: single-stranded-DNA-specific exonuclease RecJ [Neobacillus]|jgi:single-stranded-DNA-specific exonuclease|uniref:Single-stranded-DNA-specific exonuclease RecJ n=1 Tax=Neobacillus sedimentimangrovi TaxID=2699460 RepID=A0ABS8QHD1_9BACI|nr:single-stranded-DNA-specific exonuclease RecJ [Neobacillus sedimentimangrovi]AIM15729.1 recombinase RecJ [Bacillus sp. X1(2014)]MCD4838674.1 single-stranded-DNA-specific exonuclease RecJ [Neobacillus sedimentimangrovi]
MLKSRTRWIVRKSDPVLVKQFEKELKITPLVASLLVNRGFDTVDSARFFLFGKDEFHDPFLLKGMDIAVNRIREAIERKEPILIFGDYDADGVSSTSVLMKTLTDLGADVQFYVPNRFTEGYGPNEPAFRRAAENGIKLIITVDTGISAIHEASVAKELGLDLIITDHHEPGPVLPEALAIIHPKLPDSIYPFRDLAGVGVAFKLAHALYGRLPEHLLELALIGTIADLVPLKGENRLIAKKGLENIKVTNNIGLKTIFKLAGVEPLSINEETIAFTLGPRINAVGRLEDATMAVQLLLTNDENEAKELAEEMEALNRERQAIVNLITEEAINEVERNYPIETNKVLVLGKEGWNAGVIGIVASRLVEKYYRPTIVFSFDREKGVAKGSARSIPGFDLFQNLSTCRDILPHFGGHPMAAGMTLSIDDVGELRERLNGLANDQLTDEDFIPVTYLDEEVQINDIDLESLDELNLLSPFGVENAKPMVLINDVDITSIRKIGSDQNHLKIVVNKNGNSLDGIGFGLGSLVDEISPAAQISLIGELSINEWNNIRKPQIFVHDLSVDTWQLFDFRGQNRLNSIETLVPNENRKIIVFNKDNLDKISATLHDEVYLIENKEDAKSFNAHMANIVFADFPPSKELIIHLLSGKHPSRIYTYFYKESSDFFSTMPTRDHFKWFYAFLMQKGPIDLKRYGADIAKHRGWSQETITFMSKVFSELDFVTINNGFITLKRQTQKRDLTESKTYQIKQAQNALERDLLFSSFQELKDWFDKVLFESVELEEAF